MQLGTLPTVATTRLVRVLALTAILGGATACDINGFFLGGEGGDAGPGGGGDGDGGGGGGDGDGGMGDQPDAAPTCVPTAEKCDGIDNDCDGVPDNGFNLQSDPMNCGACGTECSRSGTIGTCSAGECSYECRTGFIDLNNDILLDGCEYFCTATTSDEVGNCDLTDNDCDGNVDEDIDVTTDILHCGGCGNACPTFNTTPICNPTESDPIGNPGVFDTGECDVGAACNCTTADCYASISPAVPGCEYRCPVNPISVNAGVPTFETEICDGIDQDCTGTPDDNLPPFDRDGLPDLGADNSCHPYTGTALAPLIGLGVCNTGTWICTGTLNCSGAGLKISDFDDCGGGDEDCDGTEDEDGEADAARQTDLLNCGACGNDCTGTITNATATCSSGACALAVCDFGWVDLDNNIANGCEYQCTPTGVETCDGLDNDCDGLIDTADPTLLDIDPVGTYCRSTGGCALDHNGGVMGAVCGIPGQGADSTVSNGVTTGRGDLAGIPSSCSATPGYYCPYDTTNVDAVGGIVTVDSGTCEPVPQEVLCDGKDNDCDASADDPFLAELGEDCFDTGIGICQATGKIACSTTDPTTTECDFSQGTPAGTALGYEECNGLDDNCNGSTDENAVDDMVAVDFALTTPCALVGDACSEGGRSGTCATDVNTCTYWVDTYEASRPDATSVFAGINEQLSCSLENKIPWALITQTDAEAACQANGKRLCTQEEWQLSCEGNTPNLYPYGDTYSKFTCNGGDWNDTCVGPGLDTMEQVFPTGFGYSPGGTPGSCPIAADSTCVSEFGAEDMSGNLREWTSSMVGSSFKVRGGSFNEEKQGLTCDNAFITLDPANSFDNLGFRCCRSTQPPVAP